jgi:hypothetical protein
LKCHLLPFVLLIGSDVFAQFVQQAIVVQQLISCFWKSLSVKGLDELALVGFSELTSAACSEG